MALQSLMAASAKSCGVSSGAGDVLQPRTQTSEDWRLMSHLVASLPQALLET